MNVYLLTIFAVFILGLIDNHINLNGKWTVWRTLIFLILVCVSGFRYRVGTDYGAYAGGFPSFVDDTISYHFSGIFEEPGIRFLAKIVSVIYYDYGVFIFACSLFTVGLYLINLSKVSTSLWMSILLFIFLGSWVVSFNAVRQCLAAAIIFSGHRYIYSRRFIKWFLIVLLATLFHSSAIMCLLLYFVPLSHLNNKGLIALIGIAILGSFLGEYFFMAKEMIKGRGVNAIGMEYATRSVNILRVLISWVPVVVYLFFLRRESLTSAYFSFYINLTIVNAAVVTIMKDSALFFRMSIYTQIFLAVSWPMIISRLPQSRRYLFSTLLLCVYFVWFIYEVGSDTDFNWIFNRPSPVYYRYL